MPKTAVAQEGGLPLDRPQPGAAAVMLVLLCLALFFSSLGSHDLWSHDEVRYALVAREMLENQHYLVPHMNAEVQESTPPLMLWLTVGFAELLSLEERYEISARLPSAVAGLLIILLTWGYASRRWDRWTGFAAGLVLATSLQFFWLSRSGTGDALIALGITVTVLALAEAVDGRFRIGFATIAAAAGLFVCGLSGGLFAVCYALIIATGYGSYARRPVMTVAAGATAVLLAGLLATPWLLWAQQDSAGQYAIPVWPAETAAHQPPWYYAVSIIRDWLPWSLFIPGAIWAALRERDVEARTGMGLVWSWCVIPIIGLSLVQTKDARWLLPVYPGIAMGLAVFFRRHADDLSPLYGAKSMRWPAMALVTVLLALGLSLLAVRWWPTTWQHAIAGLHRTSIFSGTAILALTGWAILHHAARPPSRIIATIAVFATLGYAFSAGVIAPMLDAQRSARPMGLYTRGLAGVDKRVILFGPFQPDIAYYYGRHLDTEQDPAGILEYRGVAEPIVAILAEDAYLRLRAESWPAEFHVMTSYRIGDTSWVVATNRPPAA